MLNVREILENCKDSHKNEPSDIAVTKFKNEVHSVMNFLGNMSVVFEYLKKARDELNSDIMNTHNVLELKIKLDYYLSELNDFNYENINKYLTACYGVVKES